MSKWRILWKLCRWLGPFRILRRLQFRAGRLQLRYDLAALAKFVIASEAKQSSAGPGLLRPPAGGPRNDGEREGAA